MNGALDVVGALWPGLVAAGLAYAVLPWLPRDKPGPRVALLLVTAFLTWRYVAWRAVETLPPVGLTVDWLAGAAFFAAELGTLVGATITLLFLCRTRDRTPEVEAALAAAADAPGALPPLVDVLIPTVDEEESILERTIVGALAMDGGRFRVWALDDRRRPWLAELCARKGARYLARPTHEDAKAGNINHALAHLAALPEPPDFVSILDADFAPRPTFLTRTLALLADERVAIVQTPQHFINPDPIQMNLAAGHVYPDEQRYFFDVLMPSKDAWGATFCCGTSCVIRFSALQAVGGFPVESVTEDYLLTLKLHLAGWRTVYLAEKLSLGLAPEGLKEYVTQRGRWCLGLIQICRGPLGPLRRNGLSLLDRLILVEAFLYWAASYPYRILCIVVPLLYLLFDVRAVQADLDETLSHFLPYYVSQVAVMAWIARGRLLPILADVGQLLAAPEIVRAVLVGLARPRGHRFKVTAKGGDRSRTVVQWRMLARFLALLALTAGGLLVAFVLADRPSLERSASLCLFWCWYNIVVLAVACVVCVEQPRRPEGERVPTDEPATLLVDGRAVRRTAVALSTEEVSLLGEPPASVGSRLVVALGRLRAPATVAGREDGGFRLRFERRDGLRDALIRLIERRRFARPDLRVRVSRVAAAVAGRAMR